MIAFEPDPVNFSFLVRNIDRHKLTNVTPVQAAIAGKAGRAAFNCEGATGSGLARHIDRASVGNIVMVDALSLEDAFTRWGNPQFCKIDIEGAEVEVIASAQLFLQTKIATSCWTPAI